MARRKPRAAAEEGHENVERWLLTYADMITLLMVLFIVLFAISQVDQKKFDKLHDGLAQSFGAAKLLDGSAGILQGSTKQAPTPNDPRAAEEALAQQQQAALAARREVEDMNRIRERITAALAAKGLAVILVSSDMPELIGLSHRVLVMRSGGIAGELSRADLDTPDVQERIFRHASGQEAAA